MLKIFDLIFEKLLKTGEMLKILKMFKFLGGTDVKFCILRFPKKTLTSLTFSCFKHFLKTTFSIFNIPLF